MIDAATEVRDLLERAYPLFQEWLGSETAAFQKNLVDEKLADGRPTIMVYGVYNAGKSTLLNALTGEETAPVSNRPETDSVTPYFWRDFELLDTPGIDAPKEHEEISRNQLERSDVIIFVLDSTSTFEEELVYDEMTDILGEQKPMIVVLNNRTGMENDGKEVSAALDKVLENLQRRCEVRGVDPSSWENTTLRLVDARTALKGRLEGKRLLVEESGIERLERDLDLLLRKGDFGDVVNTIGHNLRKALNEVGARVQRSDGGEASQLEEKQKAVAACRRELDGRVQDELRRLISVFRRKLPDVLRQGQSDFQGRLNPFDDVVNGVMEVMRLELERVRHALERKGLPFDPTLPDGAANRRFGFQTDNASAGQEATEGERLSGLSSAGDVVGGTARALEAARVLPPPYGTYVVLAMEVAKTVLDFYANAKEEEAAVREEKRLADVASDAAEELRGSLERECRTIADRAFRPAEDALGKEAEELDDEVRRKALASSKASDLSYEVGLLIGENRYRDKRSFQDP